MNPLFIAVSFMCLTTLATGQSSETIAPTSTPEITTTTEMGTSKSVVPTSTREVSTQAAVTVTSVLSVTPTPTPEITTTTEMGTSKSVVPTSTRAVSTQAGVTVTSVLSATPTSPPVPPTTTVTPTDPTTNPPMLSQEFIIAISVIIVVIVVLILIIVCLLLVLYFTCRSKVSKLKKEVVSTWVDTEEGTAALDTKETPLDESEPQQPQQTVEVPKEPENKGVTAGTFGFQGEVVKSEGDADGSEKLLGEREE